MEVTYDNSAISSIDQNLINWDKIQMENLSKRFSGGVN
jgi:hypothetical protein